MSRKQMTVWTVALMIQALFFAAIFGTKGFTTAHNKNWLDSLVVLLFAPHGIIGGTLGERIPHGIAGRSFWVYSLVFLGAIPVSWVYARILIGVGGVLRPQKVNQNKAPAADAASPGASSSHPSTQRS